MRWTSRVWWTTLGSVAGLLLAGCTPDDEVTGPDDDTGVVTPPGVGFPGMDARVSDLEVFDGMLYAGGRFLTAGGSTDADSVFHVAAWNGSDWSPLGDGVIDDPGIVLRGEDDLGEATALQVYDGKLAVGGRFDTAGGMPAGNIAFWDGSAWSTLPLGGPNGPVNALAVNPATNSLLVGGQFSAVGGSNTRDIAAFDGVAWRGFGAGIGGFLGEEEVNAITIFNDQVIVGGDFVTASATAASDTLANNVARWLGNRWAPMGLGLQGAVLGLAVYDGRLYASGTFDEASGTWQTEVAVDQGFIAGDWADLALDDEGNAHVAHHNGGGRDLHYAHYDGTTWTDEVVDQAGDVGRYCSIALDGGGHPAISYYDATNRDLRFARKDSLGVWSNELVRTVGDVGEWSSMVWSPPDGRFYIAYYRADSTRTANVVSKTLDGAWGNDGVIDNGINLDNPQTAGFDVGRAIDLAIDRFNRLHVAYHDATANAVRYAIRRGAWLREWLDFTPPGTDDTAAYGRYLALAVDDTGIPHAVIHDYRGDNIGGGERLRYLARIEPPDTEVDGDDWGFAETVESPTTTSGKLGRHPSIALDADGRAHVTYYDVTRARLRYARRDGPSQWRRTTLDGGNSGEFSSIALVDGRFPRVAYNDEDDRQLKLASLGSPNPIRRLACWDGTRWTELGEGVNWWARTMMVVDGELLVGGAFTEAGGMITSRLASWNGSSWTTRAEALNEAVWTLAIFEGDVYAGGEFTKRGPFEAHYVVNLSE